MVSIREVFLIQRSPTLSSPDIYSTLFSLLPFIATLVDMDVAANHRIELENYVRKLVNEYHGSNLRTTTELSLFCSELTTREP